MKRFHITRVVEVTEVLEVLGSDLDDAMALSKLQEARLLSSTESEPTIIECWEKPTGISEVPSEG